MGGEGFEPSKLSQQIYSLPPLAARESTQTLQESHLNLQNRTAYLHNLSFEKSIRMASPYSCISSAFLHRKEVIQPHLPIRLPCYDFTPVANPTFGSALLAVRLLTSGITGSHGVTGGVYKARERYSPRHADPRLLAIPTSRRRVAACDPNWGRLSGIRSPSRGGNPLYRPL